MIDIPVGITSEVVVIKRHQEYGVMKVYDTKEEAMKNVGDGMIIKEQDQEIYRVMPNINKTFQADYIEND